ncbi:tetratricopeptide repeat protein [compost metagenome]
MLALAEVVRERHGVEAALEVLRQRLAGQPSLRIIQRLLDWQGDAGSRDLDLLRDAVGSLLGNAPAYCCRHCGFQARQLYWQCPACHGWSSIRRQVRPGQP